MPKSQEIKIKIPADLARAFRTASREERLRIEKIVTLSLRARSDEAAFQEATDRLERTMDEIGESARRRGLTDEILSDIIDGD